MAMAENPENEQLPTLQILMAAGVLRMDAILHLSSLRVCVSSTLERKTRGTRRRTRDPGIPVSAIICKYAGNGSRVKISRTESNRPVAGSSTQVQAMGRVNLCRKAI